MVKTVYSSRSEIAHLWANKAQDYARNSGSFSFDREYIYSYRTKIGKYSHNTGFVLLNKNSYSNTTAKHQCVLESAVRYTSKIVRIDCYHNSYENPFKIGNVLKAFTNTYERIAKKLAKATKPQIYIAEFSELIHNIAVYNDYLKACQELQLTADDEHATEEEFAELNQLYIDIKKLIDSTDARQALKEHYAEQEAREKARLEMIKVEFLKSVKDWKKCKIDTVKHASQFHGWETDFVRLSKDGLFFETHRGAKIKKSGGGACTLPHNQRFFERRQAIEFSDVYWFLFAGLYQRQWRLQDWLP